MKKLIIIGSGGHCRVVIETAKLTGYEIVGIVDLNHSGQNETILGCSVFGEESVKNFSGCDVFIALGKSQEREEYINKYKSYGHGIPVLIHPKSILSESVKLEEGVLINAGVIINTLVNIGKGAIINTGAIIDHECEIGDFVHICPGTKIAGRVKVGNHSFIGIGTSIIDKISIGKNVVVGAGSVIIRDVSDNEKIVGVSK